mgnify:CR=1 FL=1
MKKKTIIIISICIAVAIGITILCICLFGGKLNKHIKYIDSLDSIYDKTSEKIRKIINSQKYENIIECIFSQPIISSSYLEKTINISPSQARKYISTLEEAGVLSGDDRIRNRKYYFLELLTLLENT